jgi:hypothetical protein
MVVSHVPVSLAQSIRSLVEVLAAAKSWEKIRSSAASRFFWASRRLRPAWRLCMLASSAVPSRSERTRRPVQASSLQGLLGWVRKAQAGFADGDGCQLALALLLRRLQQGREED